MSAAVWGFIGVLAGGLLSSLSPLLSETLRAKLAAAADERAFHRLAAHEASEATQGLKAVYIRYEAADAISSELDDDLSVAMAKFIEAAAKLESAKLRGLLDAWQQAAQKWVLRDGGSQVLEERAFRAAVAECGAQQRKWAKRGAKV